MSITPMVPMTLVHDIIGLDPSSGDGELGFLYVVNQYLILKV